MEHPGSGERAVEEHLREKLQELGEEEVKLIVRFRGEPEACATRLREMGFEVVREYSLLRAFAVRGKASEALKLRDEPWVEAVEEDRPVSIL